MFCKNHSAAGTEVLVEIGCVAVMVWTVSGLTSCCLIDYDFIENEGANDSPRT
jgi:hypothetical protein